MTVVLIMVTAAAGVVSFVCLFAAIFAWLEGSVAWTGAFTALAVSFLALSVACGCAAGRRPAEEVRCSTIEEAKYSSSDKACYKNGVKLNFNEEGVDE